MKLPRTVKVCGRACERRADGSYACDGGKTLALVFTQQERWAGEWRWWSHGTAGVLLVETGVTYKSPRAAAEALTRLVHRFGVAP